MFKKKVSQAAAAVVTGAGSGIGRAFALELAHRGGKVICADINLAAAEETAKQITATGGQAWAVACDVGKWEEVASLEKTAREKLDGAPNLVINNAGIGVGGKYIGEFGLDDWRATLDVNLWGVINGCHAFTPGLRKHGRGGIINVCSAASFAAAPKMGAYNVTKAAALALTETLAAELAGTGIRVTALCPTFVKTAIIDAGSRNGRIETSSSRLGSSLMQRVGIPAERVARITLNALDRGQLYVLPQLDARIVWRAKRLAPAAYNRGSAMVGNLLERIADRVGA